MKGFKEFLLRGNVLDLAVAVVVGAAFSAITSSVVTNVFNPLIAALFDSEDLANAFVVRIPLTAGTAELRFGAVLASAITFVITTAVVYFVFVLPMNRLVRRAFAKQQQDPEPAKPSPPTELDVLTQIRDLLQRQDGTDVEGVRALKTD